MKHTYRFALLLALPLASFTQDAWVTAPVDEQVSVQVPEGLQEVDLSKQGVTLTNTRVLVANDAYAMYQIIQVSMTPEQFASVQGVEDRRKYYDGVVRGMLRSQTDGELLERTYFPTAGGEGMEVKFRARHQATNKLTVKYSRSLLVGTKGYAFNIIARDLTDTAGTTTTEQRQRFFSSLIVARPAAVKQK